MAVNKADFDKIWSSTSSVPEYTFSDTDYKNGWEFVGNLPPTRAMWDKLQKRNDEKMQYLMENGTNWVDNVATLRTTDAKIGEVYGTKGYYTDNDGGQGFYIIRADASDTDDGGSIIVLDNGNVAELITDGTITVKQFGAYGDATHDDTDAFQSAFRSGYDVIIPTSHLERYVISDTLVVDNDNTKTVYGTEQSYNHGRLTESSGLVWTNPDNTVPMFDIKVQMFKMSNLFIWSANNKVGWCFKCDTGVRDVDIEFLHCAFLFFAKVFDVDGRGLLVQDCTIASIATVAVLKNTYNESTDHPEQYGQRGIRFVNNRIHAFSDRLLNVTQGHCYGLQFVGNMIDNGYGILFDVTDEAWNWNITGNTFDALNKDVPVRFNGGVVDTIISNNIFHAPDGYWSAGATSVNNYIDIKGCSGLILSNNVFDNNSGSVMMLFGNTSVSNLHIVNNSFRNVHRRAILLRDGTSVNGLMISNNSFNGKANSLTQKYVLYSASSITVENSVYTNNVIDNMDSAFNTNVLVNHSTMDTLFCKVINASDDLNNCTNGMYACNSNSIATTLSNCPVNVSFILCSYRLASTNVLQTLFAGNGSVYQRKTLSGTFGDWYEVSHVMGNSAPTTGNHVVGEIVYNDTPTAGGYVGWVCVTAGTPGTWKGFGAIEA